MDAKAFNELADLSKKMASTLQGDVMSQIRELTAKAEEISSGNNPTVREENITIGKHTVKAEVKKNGNILLLSQSNGVVEEIIKRLHNDRHT